MAKSGRNFYVTLHVVATSTCSRGIHDVLFSYTMAPLSSNVGILFVPGEIGTTSTG